MEKVNAVAILKEQYKEYKQKELETYKIIPTKKNNKRGNRNGK